MSQLRKKQQSETVRMVDISEKHVTQRTAEAIGTISMNRRAFEAVQKGTVPKGDVFSAARIAGILAAKQTPSLIPLCHPLHIQFVDIELVAGAETRSIQCRSCVKVKGRTGPEMEALSSVMVALLTIYDMCKGLDPRMTISNIRILKKTGGKSGTFTSP